MLVSQHWLRRYIPLEQSISEIEEALTLIGFEVEGVESTGLPPLENVVVGEILSSEQHPNADRLSVCQVTTGGDENHTIVCGAKNYKVGDRVPVALVGAVLPGDFKIKKSKLRGVASEGMMCSARELNLGDDHSGLFILEDRPELGTPINDVFPDSDTIFDIEVTPNRPDCLSHIGIARELAAFFGLDFAYPEVKASPSEAGGSPLINKVRVDTPENCPHYRAYSIKGVKIAPSPGWLQTLIKAVGLRPINNVVDVTNFVLHELGQPLHAFDSRKIKGGILNIRQARQGEKITTLDEKERELDKRMAVIADAERPLVVAGVMGSIDAEVDDSTEDIVLESAYFTPSNIRWTSRKLALSTDSSYRFERGVDPEGAEFAALRAIDLILEVAGGELTGAPFMEGKPPRIEREIRIAPDFVRKTLGFHAEDNDIKLVLESLQLEVHEREAADGTPLWDVGIPSFRLDLDRPIDLVEEFLRIYGTDKIPAARVEAQGIVSHDDPISVFKSDAATYLAGQHFNECLNYTLRSSSELDTWYSHAAAGNLGLTNPLASDQSHLRPSLIPGLLDTLRLNRNRGNSPVRFFEIGNVFREYEGQVWELVSVAFLIVQSPQPESWLKREEPDFYTASSIVNHLLGISGVDVGKTAYSPIQNEDTWQEGHAARISDFTKGYEAKAGLVSLSMLKNWDIEGTVLAGVLYLRPDYLRAGQTRKSYTPLSQYPPVSKDLALVVDEKAFAGQVRSDLENVSKVAAGDQFNVESVAVFDVYQGAGLPEGKKSLALSITFRSPERTLTDAEVNKAFDAIQKAIVKDTGYAIRE